MPGVNEWHVLKRFVARSQVRQGTVRLLVNTLRPRERVAIVGLAMDVTRRTRPLLAGARRGLASVLTAMFLVLAVVSAGVVCSIHLDDGPRGGSRTHSGEQVAAQTTDVRATAAEPASWPTHGGPRDCSDDHRPSAQCDPLPPVSSPGPAALPEPSTGGLVSAVVHDDTPVPATMAEATAPSLDALGISRT